MGPCSHWPETLPCPHDRVCPWLWTWSKEAYEVQNDGFGVGAAVGIPHKIDIGYDSAGVLFEFNSESCWWLA